MHAGTAPSPAGTRACPLGHTPRRGGGKLPKLQLQAVYQALASGLQATFQPTDTFNINGETLSRDEVVAGLHAVIVLIEATKAVRQQWTRAVQPSVPLWSLALPSDKAC